MEKKLRQSLKKADKQPTGRVIGIIKRNWRSYCGVLRPKESKTVILWGARGCTVNLSAYGPKGLLQYL